MAKYKLNANSTIDLLTPQEHLDNLDKQTKDWFQEQARGFTIERYEATATVAAAAITLPAAGHSPIGPKTGYAWKVTRISISGLLSGDGVQIYRNSTDPQNFIDTLSSSRPAAYPKSGLILRGGETLIATGSSLTATGDLTLTGEVTECSELDLYKIL
jgi:hypothetical protein